MIPRGYFLRSTSRDSTTSSSLLLLHHHHHLSLDGGHTFSKFATFNRFSTHADSIPAFWERRNGRHRKPATNGHPSNRFPILSNQRHNKVSLTLLWPLPLCPTFFYFQGSSSLPASMPDSPSDSRASLRRNIRPPLHALHRSPVSSPVAFSISKIPTSLPSANSDHATTAVSYDASSRTSCGTLRATSSRARVSHLAAWLAICSCAQTQSSDLAVAIRASLALRLNCPNGFWAAVLLVLVSVVFQRM